MVKPVFFMVVLHNLHADRSSAESLLYDLSDISFPVCKAERCVQQLHPQGGCEACQQYQ